MAQPSRQQKTFEIATKDQFATPSVELGPWASYSLREDPKHMSFVLARYKFAKKMMEGKRRILEIGCGDGFGMPIAAQDAEYVLGVDVDTRLLEGNQERLATLKNVEWQLLDICKETPKKKFDAAFSIDVIEHLDAGLDGPFMENSLAALHDDAVYIVGTPNETANAYASERSRIQHINLKTHQSLRQLMLEYFENVLMFGMNDEVIHTGYPAMCHYLFAVGAGKRRRG